MGQVMTFITANTQEQFNNALLQAQNGDIIEVENSIFKLPRIDLKNRKLTIQSSEAVFDDVSDDCEIFGQGVISFENCIFQNLSKEIIIKNTSVNFNKCNFDNENSRLYIDNSIVNLSDCNFNNISENCSIWACNNSNLEIIDCEIKRTKIVNKVLVYVNNSKIIAKNSNFYVKESNALTLDNGSSASLDNCTWYSTKFLALVLKNLSQATVINNEFKNGYSGILVNNSNLDVSDSNFINIHQGSIVDSSNNSEVKFKHCNFQAKKQSDKNNVLLSDSKALFESCEFSKINNAHIIKLNNYSFVEMIDCRFQSTGDYSAIAIFENSLARISDSQFISGASGIFLDNGLVDIQSSKFIDIVEKNWVQGIKKSTIKITDSQFNCNEQLSVPVLWFSDSNIFLENNEFNNITNNVVRAIENTQLDIVDCVFNDSDSEFSALSIESSSKSNIVNCNFNGKSSGIYINNSTVDVENCYFECIDLAYMEVRNKSNISIFNSDFYKDYNSGNVVLFFADSDVKINNCYLDSNSTNAIKTWNSNLIIFNSHLESSQDRRLIYLEKNSKLFTNNCILNGDLYAQDSSIEIKNSKIEWVKNDTIFSKSDNTKIYLKINNCFFDNNCSNFLISINGNVSLTAENIYFNKNISDLINKENGAIANIDNQTNQRFLENEFVSEINYGRQDDWENKVVVNRKEIIIPIKPKPVEQISTQHSPAQIQSVTEKPTVSSQPKINNPTPKVQSTTYHNPISNSNKKMQYTIFSGFASLKWWIVFGGISYYNYSRYDSKMDNLNKWYDEAEERLPQVKREYNYLLEKSHYGSTVCEDGWISQSGGQGACSHHGGVDYDIDYRLKSLQSQINTYNERLHTDWYIVRKSKIDEFHWGFEAFVLVFLLFLYKIIKST